MSLLLKGISSKTSISQDVLKSQEESCFTLKKKITEESRERENEGEKGRKDGKMKPEAHFWVNSNALSSIWVKWTKGQRDAAGVLMIRMCLSCKGSNSSLHGIIANGTSSWR